ncbi:MAG: T9SS type A sorting domain-containing protein [Bacteroidales bacterium]|nr:T9SS type A sorting domain-containing protein [Bacteroidales bacterium]
MKRFLKNIVLVVFFIGFSTYSAVSQVIYTNPVFPIISDSVTIFFDASQGSGGLSSYSGDVYAHTGLITELSSSTSDWKYVKTNWGQNTPETKLTKIGSTLYKLTISPNITSYYGVPTSEKVLKLAFVFRSSAAVNGSYLEGKNQDGSDIFVDVFESGLALQINKPYSGYSFVNQGDKIPVKLESINADSIFLFQNGVLIRADSGNFLTDTLTAPAAGKFWVKGVAKNATDQVADSFFYMIHNAPDTVAIPAGIVEGINYLSDSQVVLCLFAPYHDYIYLIGDFNNWEPDPAFNMNITPDNKYFWIQVNNLIPQKEYIFQYLVDGEIAVGDPYAEKVSDPWNDSYISSTTYPNVLPYPAGKTNGIATVFQTNQTPYQWKYGSYSVINSEELIVYELLIRDFHPAHSFKSVMDSLNYLKSIGINAIELMPVNEFEGNSSWGYNPNYYFAVDKYYGPANDLKKLIDSCHSLGIAVILDVVYNHSFGTSPYVRMWWDSQNNRPSFENPFFNPFAKHDFNVGFDMNHESIYTKRYISRALKFWLEEYRVDGFRFDLSKGFTQTNTLGNSSAMANYDASRIAILSAYSDTVWSVNPQAYVILEHFADNSEEKVFASRGMMLWGNLNGAYNEAAMGYNSGTKSDFSWISWQKRGWAAPKVMGYMESHDEERAMYKCSMYGNTSGNYSIKEKSTFMKRASMNATFFLTIPGPKMIWQFGELGYDISIDFNGRTGEKPIKWDYASDTDRWNNYLVYKALNHLRKEESALFQTDSFALNVAGELKTIHLYDNQANAVIVGNFDVEFKEAVITFPHSGIWYEFFSGTEVEVNDNAIELLLLPGEYHLFLDKSRPKPELVIPASTPSLIYDFEGMLKVFPNPGSENLNIVYNVESESVLQIFDSHGRLVGESKVTGSKSPQTISLTNLGISLNNGVYICRLSSNDKSESVKFIVL